MQRGNSWDPSCEIWRSVCWMIANKYVNKCPVRKTYLTPFKIYCEVVVWMMWTVLLFVTFKAFIFQFTVACNIVLLYDCAQVRPCSYVFFTEVISFHSGISRKCYRLCLFQGRTNFSQLTVLCVMCTMHEAWLLPQTTLTAWRWHDHVLSQWNK